MINDFKLGIQVLKYGLNIKVALIGSIILLLMGVGLEFMAPNMPSNGLYTGMGGMMFMQTICSVSVSSMVQTSALKKRLQTSVPTIVTSCYMLVIHTIFLLIKWVGCGLVYPFAFSELSRKIVLDAVMLVIIVVYNAAALKKPGISTVLFIIVYFGVYFSSVKDIIETKPFLPIQMAIVLSYVILLVGCVLLYLLLKALYKKPYNKMSFESMLKRVK